MADNEKAASSSGESHNKAGSANSASAANPGSAAGAAAGHADPEQVKVDAIGAATDLSDSYQMVSDPVKHTAEAMGMASGGAPAGGLHDEDSGREPEEYIEKQTGAGSVENDNAKGFDIQGPSGRQQTQHPTSGEHHAESGN